jgi:hypothetical protein
MVEVLSRACVEPHQKAFANDAIANVGNNNLVGINRFMTG